MKILEQCSNFGIGPAFCVVPGPGPVSLYKACPGLGQHKMAVSVLKMTFQKYTPTNNSVKKLQKV